MEEAGLLKQICKTEIDHNFNKETILGLPLWRIVRYKSRLYYVNKKTGYVAPPPKSTMVGKPHAKLLSGFWHYLNDKNLSIVFPFNRLVNINGVLIDKFTDPGIIESKINECSYVIVDPPTYSGNYPRINRKNTLSEENRTPLQQILKYFFKFYTPIKYGRIIKQLFSKVQISFELPDGFISYYYSQVSEFLSKYYFYLFWFKLLKPHRVFIVFREGYFPQIAVCKRMGIPVAEFQHGITLDDTVSFAGKYDRRIDPDYFLVFGEYWKGPQFGMPLDRIVNIGWAYSKYLQKTIAPNADKHERRVLVISSPEISGAILDALKVLSETPGDYSLDIRLHPCESYNDDQKIKLQSILKARVVDNKTDSALVLPTYKYVVGENSSVIYEALSVGCKVGMLNLCGLKPAIDLPGIKENFFVINDANDFEQFLSEEKSSSASKAEFYSDFDSETFMKFINEKM